MTAWQLLKAYGEQVFIAFDQLANALIPPIDGTIGYADETLSARCYRAHRDGKILGKLFMPPIDLVFGLWQGPNHCRNAYIKEFERKNYPEEYRAANVALCWAGHIDQGVFATVTALTVGGYITGNVVQKATAKDAAP